MGSSALPQAEIVVVGAGIIGLSVALELRLRGADVLVVDEGKAMAGASTAAAGMLAAHDPHNPRELQALADFSIDTYDRFLASIASLSGHSVPYQTLSAIQYRSDGAFTTLDERSLDPRQLGPALLLAARNSGVKVLQNVASPAFGPAKRIIHTMGAWSERFRVRPRKGQMLRVQLPSACSLTQVHRSENVYVVPRTEGPQDGTALIGATVEDVGFDLSTNEKDLNALRLAASRLSEKLHFLRDAVTVEAWAGLRPSTPDNLPFLGAVSESEIVATGHFRNGILLAPATAKVIADLVDGVRPPIDLTPFAPYRFAC